MSAVAAIERPRGQIVQNVGREMQGRLERIFWNHLNWVAKMDLFGKSPTIKAFPYTFWNGIPERANNFILPDAQADTFPAGEPNQSAYVVMMPYVPSLKEEERYKDLRRILSALGNDTFGVKASDSLPVAKKRLAVVLGINWRTSLDPMCNQKFEEYVRAIPRIEGVTFRCFGFYWGQWIACLKGRALYSINQALDLVHFLKDSVFQEVKNSYTVPYQQIRERILHSREVHSLFSHFAVAARGAPLYAACMDPDFHELRTDGQGLFSHYDQIISASRTSLDILSTGYLVGQDACDVLRHKVSMDMRIRREIAPIFSRLLYYPEPNFIFRIVLEKLSQYSFISKDSATDDAESRRVIVNGITKGLFDPSKMHFAAKGAIVTTSPERWKDQIPYNLRDITINATTIGQEKVLSAIGSKGQSFACHRFWATNMYWALGVKFAQVAKINQPLSLLHSLFNPLCVVKGFSAVIGHYAYVKNFREFLHICPYYFRALVSESEPNYPELLKKYKSPEREAFTGWMQAARESLQKKKSTLVSLKIPQEKITLVVRCAEATGKAILQYLQEISGVAAQAAAH